MGPSPLHRSVSPSVPGTGGERRLSAELTSLPGPGALSIRISPPQPMLSRGRPDSKVAPVVILRSVCSAPGPPVPLPGSLWLSCLSPNCQTENRRITHISAEQKRRFNIKLGFDTLHGLVSTLSTQPNLKVSVQAPPAACGPPPSHPSPNPKALHTPAGLRPCQYLTPGPQYPRPPWLVPP